MSSFKKDVTKAVYTVKDEVGGAMTSVKDGVGRTVSTVKDDVERAVGSVKMWTWRQWIRPVFVIFYSLFVCVAFPILIWDMYYHEEYLQAFSWLTAGLCALVAIGVSGYGILSHLVYFTRPNQQRYIVRYAHDVSDISMSQEGFSSQSVTKRNAPPAQYWRQRK